MTEEQKQKFDARMRSDDGQADLYKMYLATDNGGKTFWSVVKSWFTDTPASKYAGMDLKERLTNIIQNDTLAKYSLRTKEGERVSLKNEEKLDVLDYFIKKNADDFSLSFLYADNVWRGIADNITGISNPTMIMGNTMDIEIDTSREMINPSIGMDFRASVGCKSENCGGYGALRKRYNKELQKVVLEPHQGIDILAKYNSYVLAPFDGEVIYRDSSDDSKKALPGVNIFNPATGRTSLVLYVNSKEYGISNKPIKVRQGDIIGRGITDAEIHRVYGKDTPNHLHVEYFRREDIKKQEGKDDFRNPLPYVFPDILSNNKGR